MQSSTLQSIQVRWENIPFLDKKAVKWTSYALVTLVALTALALVVHFTCHTSSITGWKVDDLLLVTMIPATTIIICLQLAFAYYNHRKAKNLATFLESLKQNDSLVVAYLARELPNSPLLDFVKSLSQLGKINWAAMNEVLTSANEMKQKLETMKNSGMPITEALETYHAKVWGVIKRIEDQKKLLKVSHQNCNPDTIQADLIDLIKLNEEMKHDCSNAQLNKNFLTVDGRLRETFDHFNQLLQLFKEFENLNSLISDLDPRNNSEQTPT